jgi:hypothetical protein
VIFLSYVNFPEGKPIGFMPDVVLKCRSLRKFCWFLVLFQVIAGAATTEKGPTAPGTRDKGPNLSDRLSKMAEHEENVIMGWVKTGSTLK